jgi:hypothetical protein
MYFGYICEKEKEKRDNRFFTCNGLTSAKGSTILQKPRGEYLNEAYICSYV